ncbi:Hypothetical Protein FCC1311_076232 [Hondaea fermentalgiana]|uniref:Uncharacterized protein n=1 Tax=Hondaea fermentalgiana TaxID=2315210 RepID=A0A2R5GM60_9STRA|nr:Hypothetical Protein FCC1311_076232 [Hondaea fermentalgiana]|eukprot:GBG31399.1 Hypothetical Protein FCC1311_076232 [Hondaea fermentalgiana]
MSQSEKSVRKLSLARLGRSLALSAGSRRSASSKASSDASSRATGPSKVDLDDVYDPKAEEFQYENHRFEEADEDDEAEQTPEMDDEQDGKPQRKKTGVERETAEFLAELEFAETPRPSAVLRSFEDDLEGNLELDFHIERLKKASERSEKKKKKKQQMQAATMRGPIRGGTSLRRVKKAVGLE